MAINIKLGTNDARLIADVLAAAAKARKTTAGRGTLDHKVDHWGEDNVARVAAAMATAVEAVRKGN